MSPNPKHKVSQLTTNVDISQPLMSFREMTDDHQIDMCRGFPFDIGLNEISGFHAIQEVVYTIAMHITAPSFNFHEVLFSAVL